MHRVPQSPDFASIDAKAPKTAEQRTTVLALIGNLVFSWSNNESLFVYLLASLLQTDEVSAAVVFSTLNTTRARLDVIQRLARVKIRDEEVAKELDSLVKRFNNANRTRNEFNHCLYSLGPNGEIAQTQSMKLQEVKGQLRWGQIKPMDDLRMKQMVKSINDLKKLNRDIWAFLPRLEAECSKRRQPPET